MKDKNTSLWGVFAWWRTRAVPYQTTSWYTDVNMKETPDPQTPVQTTKPFAKNLRPPILIMLAPVLLLGFSLLTSTVLSQMYSTPASPLIGYFHPLIIIVAILSLLAILPCLIIGAILLFKRIRVNKLAASQGYLDTPTTPHLNQHVLHRQPSCQWLSLYSGY